MPMFGLIKDSVILTAAAKTYRSSKRGVNKRPKSRNYPIFEPKERRKFEVWPPQ